MRRTLRLGAFVLAAVLPLATACGDDDTTAQPSPAPTSASPEATMPELAITGVDYGFTIAGSVTAGMTKISFTNAGAEEHMTGLGKIKAGKTLADVQAALKNQQDEGAFAAVFDDKEGDKDAPQVLSPGRAMSTYTTLSEGTYALVCFLPAPDGKSHHEKGMIAEVKVGPATAGAAVAPPTGAVELTFAGGKLSGPASLPAGKTLFSVKTDANHELLGVIGLGGKTPEQGFAYFEKKFEGDKPPTGPAEGAIVAQLHDFNPGETILFELELTTGPVLFFCQLENDGAKKHAEKLTITVT